MNLQDKNILVSQQSSSFLQDCIERFEIVCDRVGVYPHSKIVIVSNNTQILIDAVVGFYHYKSDGVITTKERFSIVIEDKFKNFGYAIIIVDDEGMACVINKPIIYNDVVEQISIFTSGTTGTPKIISHTWHTLFTMYKVKNSSPQRWFSPYLPGTYAWYQMILMWMFIPSQVLIVPSLSNPEEMWKEIIFNNVNAISATPSFWRYLLLINAEDELSSAYVTQITLGGKYVDQILLDKLHHLFPTARLTHIYASTETGAAIIVHDGKEGFPIHGSM